MYQLPENVTLDLTKLCSMRLDTEQGKPDVFLVKRATFMFMYIPMSNKFQYPAIKMSYVQIYSIFHLRGHSKLQVLFKSTYDYSNYESTMAPAVNVHKHS